MNLESLIFILITLLIFVILFGSARLNDKIILNSKIKKINKMKDSFISIASHELRTPLTIIKGYVELLNDEENISAEGKENIKRINNASTKLENLVDDMLDVSSLENGLIEFNFQIIDPVSVAHGVVNNFGNLARQKGLDLSLKVKSTANINVDPVYLKKVLSHLVKNGIKFTENNSVILKINIDGGELFITVSDTGIGISEEDQKNVFNKFFKNENNLNKGAGLGLWVAKELVKKMKGKISVKSKLGVGSDFIIKFPIVI